MPGPARSSGLQAGSISPRLPGIHRGDPNGQETTMAKKGSKKGGGGKC